MTIQSLEEQARKTVLNFAAKLGDGKHKDEALFAETNAKQGHTTNPIGYIWVMGLNGYMYVTKYPDVLHSSLLKSSNPDLVALAEEHIQKTADHPEGTFDGYKLPDVECSNGKRSFVKRVTCAGKTYIVGSGFCLP